MTFISFPSIDQFRNAVGHVRRKAHYVGRDENDDPIYDQSLKLPTLQFSGTVKLHGTNAAVVVDMKTKEVTFQSRSREINVQSDNAGFALYMSRYTEYFQTLAMGLNQACPADKIAIFGEWCGKGIQSGVAVSEIDRIFVVFAVKYVYDDNEHANIWLTSGLRGILFYGQEFRIYNIYEFEHYTVEINFNYPETCQNELVKITEKVERCCPVGRQFGVEGIGEGVVWKCDTESWYGADTWFKVKGEKHSVSKVKTLASVDPEAVAGIRDFVEMAVTEQRLEQGIAVLQEQGKPLEMSSTGDFLRWLMNDIFKEEADTLVANQLEPKKLGGPIANKARIWYMKKLDELATGL